MGKKRRRLPAYDSIIGGDTEINGGIRFVGALHIDGRVVGNVNGQSPEGCALTLGQSGVIEGNVDVAYVVLGGTVKGSVRAVDRVELDAGARIEGKLYYRTLQVPEGAEINGELVHMDDAQALQPPHQGEGEEGDQEHEENKGDKEEEPTGDEKDPKDGVSRRRYEVLGRR